MRGADGQARGAALDERKVDELGQRLLQWRRRVETGFVHVYLVPKASIRASSDLKDTMFVDLGGLRAFKGSQRYSIPAGLDLKGYHSVIIWCERFGVLISPADLALTVAAR